MGVIIPISRVGRSNEEDGPNFVVPQMVVSPHSSPMLRLVIVFLIIQDQRYVGNSA